jgi:aminocarboxymuconate-semialdehyde decarboxylase
VRSAVDMLGADHVVVGTDWPIVDEENMPVRVQAALDACGLGSAEQRMVASGNTLRLLGIES